MKDRVGMFWRLKILEEDSIDESAVQGYSLECKDNDLVD
jgi:hypothetical protein